MDRRDFIKKATMAAAGAAVVSPVSAMLDSVTSGKTPKVHELYQVKMMKKQIILLTVSLMTAFAWAQSPTIKVEGGMVQGVPSAASGVTVFRGIPYAAPPVGDLRWKRPQPVVKWKGVKVADTFSNICWQPVANALLY